jgi:hypothetical protein
MQVLGCFADNTSLLHANTTCMSAAMHAATAAVPAADLDAHLHCLALVRTYNSRFEALAAGKLRKGSLTHSAPLVVSSRRSRLRRWQQEGSCAGVAMRTAVLSHSAPSLRGRHSMLRRRQQTEAVQEPQCTQQSWQLQQLHGFQHSIASLSIATALGRRRHCDDVPATWPALAQQLTQSKKQRVACHVGYL